MKKYISILLLLLLTCQPGYSTSGYHISKTDSLTRVIENLSHNDTLRLSALRELARIEQSTEKGLELATELLHDAQRLQVDKYVVFGVYYSLVYYYNYQHTDSVIRLSDFVLPIAEKEKMWMVYFDIFKIRTNAYSFQENFELAINEALIMKEKAKETNYPDGIVAANMCLTTAYIESERWAEGLAASKEAYEIALNAQHEMVAIEVLGVLTSISLQMQNYPDVYKYLNEFEVMLAKHLESSPFHETIYSYYTFIEIYYAYYYIKTDNLDKAFSHLMKVRELLEKNSFIMYRVIYQDAISEYYRAQSKYHQALAHLDTSIIMLKDFMTKDYYKQLSKKADLLVQMGETEKALAVYQMTITGKDSLSQAISNKQLAQIHKIYDLNNYQIEKQKIKNERQRILLILICVTTLLGLIFMIRAIFVRKQLRKAANEMREAAEIVNEANHIKDTFLSNLSYNIRAPLNNVVGFSQLMSADPDMSEEQRKEYGDIVKENSAELINLVNSVLDLSRLESGMMKYNISKQTIDEIAINVQYLVKVNNNKSVTILFDNKAGKEVIETDTTRFTQLLLSTLTFPVPDEKPKEVSISVNKDIADNLIRFTILDSPLANPQYATQEIYIQNEINRLFIEHFQGTYSINPEAFPPHTIVFAYPVSK